MVPFPRSDFKELATSHAADLGMNMSGVAEALKVNPGTLSLFLNGGSHSPVLAVNICRLLNIPEEYAYRTCGKPLPLHLQQPVAVGGSHD